MCDAQWPRPELLAILDVVEEDEVADKLKELEAATDHCPACIVSAWRQASPKTEVQSGWSDDGGYESSALVPLWPEYDYKAKSAEYMAQKREDETSQYAFCPITHNRA